MWLVLCCTSCWHSRGGAGRCLAQLPVARRQPYELRLRALGAQQATVGSGWGSLSQTLSLDPEILDLGILHQACETQPFHFRWALDSILAVTSSGCICPSTNHPFHFNAQCKPYPQWFILPGALLRNNGLRRSQFVQVRDQCNLLLLSAHLFQAALKWEDVLSSFPTAPLPQLLLLAAGE